MIIRPACIRFAVSNGGHRSKGTAARAGVGDLCFIGRSWPLFVELKRRDGRQSDALEDILRDRRALADGTHSNHQA